MLDLLQRVRWDQVMGFLEAGDPPLILQLLVLNTVLLVFLIIRRARGLGALNQTVLLYVQGALVAVNCLVLYQVQITLFLDRSIRTISNIF